MTATDDQRQKASTLLEEGNRALSLNDSLTSVSKLGEACQLFDSIYGELAPECGDAYYSYGEALLQHAIEQNTVLGNTGNAAEPPQAPSGSSKQQPAKSAKFHFEDDDQADEEGEEEEEEDGKEAEEDDFEMAWDMLDLARVVFEKDEGKRLKLADVHLCLGDVSAETEKFDQAVQDYRKALEIKRGLLEEFDRQLAEAHYKIALALEFSTAESDLAGAEIQKAIDVLKKRLDKIQATSDGKGKAPASDMASDNDDRESGEIKELITIMEEKVEELTSRQKTQKEAEAALKTLFGGASDGNLSSAAASALANAAVNDLSSLVKRKKTEEGEESNKKQKQ